MFGRVEKVFVNTDAKNATGENPTDREGNVLNGIDQVLEYGYNVKGEQTTMLRDNNVDGKYDYREAYTLDANGRRIEQEVDLTNDGTFDRKEVYTKEADDGLVQTNFYNLVDNRDVLTKIEYYKLNENNQRTELKLDILGDSSINAITKYDLDALGRTEKAYFDTDGNGKVDRTETYTLNPNGQASKTEVDIGNDNNVDSIRKLTLDPLGRVIKAEFFNGISDKANSVEHYTYDNYDRQIEVKYDNGNDSKIDRAVYNTYDSVGNLTSSWNDSQGNGIKDAGDSYVEYSYDEYGRDISRLVDTFDGSTPTKITVEYNNLGQEFKLTYDYENNGKFDNRDVTIERRFDDQYRIIAEKTIEVNGTVRTSSEFELNADNVRIKTYNDVGGDGTINFLSYGYWAGRSTVNHTDDLTKWTPEQVAKFNKGLNLIYLSDGSASTQITLDTNVVAQLSKSGFDIRGDGTDTVNLKGNFTKVEEVTKNVDTGELQAYRTQVDGSTYTLYIDTDINLTLG